MYIVYNLLDCKTLYLLRGYWCFGGCHCFHLPLRAFYPLMCWSRNLLLIWKIKE